MRQFTQNEETTELLNELEANEIEYEVREHGKIYVDVFGDDDELEGIFKIQFEPYWDAFKVIYFYLEGDEIKETKNVSFSIEQVIENVLG